MNTCLAGTYVCSAHIGKATENDYHHVKIIPDGRSFRWTNRAGVSWSLTIFSEENLLSVSSDCPYFSQGYTRCRVDTDSRGKIVALYGPFNERYDRLEQVSRPRPPLILSSSSWRANKSVKHRHAMILPLSSTGPSWGDLAFLAAIPASAVLNQGRRPTVLVPDDISDKDDDAFKDFIMRYAPTDVMVFHSDQLQIETTNECTTDDGIPTIQHETWDTLESVVVALAKAAWPSNKSKGTSPFRIVVAPKDDYAAALLASSLAARTSAPLFFIGDDWDDSVLCTVRDLRPGEVIFVGKGVKDKCVSDCIANIISQGLAEKAAPRAISIPTVTDAISWLTSQNVPVEYLALVNPADRTANEKCKSRKLSLTGPIYAARRDGLVVPTSNISVESKYAGAISRNRDLRRALQTLGSAIAQCPRGPPDHVALVGGFDVLPPYETDSDCNNSKIYAVTDIPYGQLDGNDCSCNNKFRDMAVGRIYAESLCCGTLLAARTVNYELLLDKRWKTSIVEAGTWGFPELSRLFQVARVDKSPKHLRKADVCRERIVEAAAILHKDHSSAVGLGNFVSCQTLALYTPAVVLTRGCHGAGIDEGHQWHGSVAGRMLGRGVVCYVGSPRSPTTANTLTEVAFFHELLYGGSREEMSVGRAMCLAFNKAMVHYLDGGRMSKYCLENEVLLGDPALVPCFAGTGVTAVAESLLCGNIVNPAASASMDDEGIVTVVGPSEWSKTPIHRDQLKEWKYDGHLCTYVAPCVEQETIWCSKGYDRQELYHVVSIDLPAGIGVQDVVALDATERFGGTSSPITKSGLWTERWWPSKRHFLQRHWDGSTTVRWRVRLLDYDMESGAIQAELKSARFRLTFT